MLVNPLVVTELRSLFKSGATPSLLIRRIADHHGSEPKIDLLVRAYFREAFHVPMLRVGLDQISQIAAGGSLSILNVSVVHRMIQTRRAWDSRDESSERVDACWLDSVVATEEANLIATTDPKSLPELAGSWDRMDDEAKQFVVRILSGSHLLHEKASALAALAEQLQQQLVEAEMCNSPDA